MADTEKSKRPRNPRGLAAAQAKSGAVPNAPPAPTVESADAEAEAKADDERIARILSPETPIELMDGTVVVVRPWSFSKTTLLTFHLERIYRCFMDAQSKDSDSMAKELLEGVFPDTMVLVRESIGWTEEKFEGITMEDGLELTQAMVTTCLIRPDGRGLLPKVAELMQVANGLFSAVEK